LDGADIRVVVLTFGRQPGSVSFFPSHLCSFGEYPPSFSLLFPLALLRSRLAPLIDSGSKRLRSLFIFFQQLPSPRLPTYSLLNKRKCDFPVII